MSEYFNNVTRTFAELRAMVQNVDCTTRLRTDGMVLEIEKLQQAWEENYVTYGRIVEETPHELAEHYPNGSPQKTKLTWKQVKFLNDIWVRDQEKEKRELINEPFDYVKWQEEKEERIRSAIQFLKVRTEDVAFKSEEVAKYTGSYPLPVSRGELMAYARFHNLVAFERVVEGKKIRYIHWFTKS